MLKENGITHKDVNTITKGIEEQYLLLDENETEFFLEKKYTVNWACIWNDPKTIGMKCKILTVDNKIAFVLFEDQTLHQAIKNMPKNLFRKQDLS